MKKAGKIGILLFVLIIGVLILPFFINPKKFYDYKDDKVYFGKTELEGIKASEFKQLTYNVAIDCVYVYYRGKQIDFVDRATLKHLGNNTFYADKNGIYYETSRLYRKNQFSPLNKGYDKETFQEIEFTNYYKDKDHVYTMDVFSDPPIKKVKLDGIDVPSFEAYSLHWLVDKNSVYFDPFHISKKMRKCAEIDRETFEVVDFIIAKDKNNVYYLSRDLSSNGENATDIQSYKILKDADATTFERTGDNEYQDKNSTFTID